MSTSGWRSGRCRGTPPGWELVYDHPEDHAQVIRREESTYALACTLHRHAKAVSTQNEERSWRERAGWCPGCVAGLPPVADEMP